jgi:hypothetical protein
MSLDPVSVAPPNLVHQPGQLAVGYVLTPPAVRADQMVVVFVGIAHHVRVRAARQLEPFDDS